MYYSNFRNRNALSAVHVATNSNVQNCLALPQEFAMSPVVQFCICCTDHPPVPIIPRQHGITVTGLNRSQRTSMCAFRQFEISNNKTVSIEHTVKLHT